MDKQEIMDLVNSILAEPGRKHIGMAKGLRDAVTEAAKADGFNITQGPRSELPTYVAYLLLARPKGTKAKKAIAAFRLGSVPD